MHAGISLQTRKVEDRREVQKLANRHEFVHRTECNRIERMQERSEGHFIAL